MRAVIMTGPGDVDVLQMAEVATPKPGPHELLVAVHASSLNRIDILRRRGLYPKSADDSNILGLDVAGDVAAVGSAVKQFSVGDKVFGLVKQGAYAEYCLLPEVLAMPIPENLAYTEAAAIPEVFFTAEETVLQLGQLQAGQTLLLHAAGSGVGVAALQLAKAIGAKVIFTAGSDAKIAKLLALGGDVGINYRTQDFAELVLQATNNIGVDVVEDFIGKDYFARNLAVLKPGGCLVQVAFMSGATTEIDLRLVLQKRLHIIGSVLRSRDLADKAVIKQRFAKTWLPLFGSGKLHAVIDKVFAFAEVQAAHQYMEANLNFGKIILQHK